MSWDPLSSQMAFGPSRLALATAQYADSVDALFVWMKLIMARPGDVIGDVLSVAMGLESLGLFPGAAGSWQRVRPWHKALQISIPEIG